MAYIKETWESLDGRFKIIKKHHSLRCIPETKDRKKKLFPTTEDQAKINNRHRREKYMRLLADNFHAGDYYITLTTDSWLSADELKAKVKYIMDVMRKECKKRGAEFRWFRVLENIKSRGKPHAHLLVENFCEFQELKALLNKHWNHGFTKVENYGGDLMDAYRLASYCVKQTQGGVNAASGAKIDTSRRNLIRREPKKTVVHSGTFREDIKPPKGYQEVKPISYDSYTSEGYPFQIRYYERTETFGAKSKECRSPGQGRQHLRHRVGDAKRRTDNVGGTQAGKHGPPAPPAR